MRFSVLTALVFIVALPGCGEQQAPQAGISEDASRALRPADTALAEIYDRSCRSCHTVLATGAPLTGDSSAWASRLEKGRNTLVDNAINGIGGMPPFGLCMDCDVEQFGALIDFMAAAP